VGKTDDEHNLDSVERTAPLEDPTAAFLEWLTKNPNRRNNPFFPRVLSRDPGSAKHVPTYHVERLVPLTDKHIDHPDLITSLWDVYLTIPPPAEPTAALLAKRIEHTVSAKRIADFKDPMLRAAIVQMATYAEEHNVEFDLHLGNMMWRITGNMPQLVFSDPFSV
jgi:hypothetical protein